MYLGKQQQGKIILVKRLSAQLEACNMQSMHMVDNLRMCIAKSFLCKHDVDTPWIFAAVSLVQLVHFS